MSTKRKISVGLFLLFVLIMIALIHIVIWELNHPVIENLHCYAEGMHYNDVDAVSDDFYTDYNETEYIGRTDDKEYNVYITGEKISPDLFIFIGSDNTYCFRNSEYEIPTSGKITKVFIDPEVRGDNRNIITDSNDINMINSLLSVKGKEKVFHIDNYYTNGYCFYFAYDNCPATIKENLGGYIAYTDDKWIFVSPENLHNKITNLSNNSVDLQGIEITDKDILKMIIRRSAS